MNNAQMLAALAALPDPDYMDATTLDAPLGTGTSYTARNVVLLLEKQRRNTAKLEKAARALLELAPVLESDGSTCDWKELQSALVALRRAIDGLKPNVELSGLGRTEER